MNTIRWATIFAAAAAAACGGPAAPAAGNAQALAQSYQAVGRDMGTTVSTFQSSASTMSDPGTCLAVEDHYAAAMGPLVDRMRTLSGSMDHYLAGSADSSWADMDCVAGAMMAEYARHRSAACTSGDIATDRAEASHHGATMAGWIEHQRVRYEQMCGAMGITPPSGDTTWTCFHHPDGSFTIDGYHWTPSDPAPTPSPTPDPAPWPRPCGGSMCPCH